MGKSFFNSFIGTVYIEFSFILPIVVVTAFTAFDITDHILLKHRLLRVAGSTLNVANFPNLKEQTLTSFLDRTIDKNIGYSIDTKAQVVVSHIGDASNIGEAYAPQISWQYSHNGGVSRIGTSGSIPSNLPNNITVTREQTLVVVEVIYNFERDDSGVLSIFGDKEIYTILVSPPRMGTSNVLL